MRFETSQIVFLLRRRINSKPARVQSLARRQPVQKLFAAAAAFMSSNATEPYPAISRFTRRGRESNPRIAVLQTATLPLGYPAVFEETQTIWARRNGVNVESVEPLHR